MGLSAFWTAIKRPRVSEQGSRKQVDHSYDNKNKQHSQPRDSPALETEDSSPHHFDAIYDTHHHILPTSNKGPKRHPSSPPRIHSPTKQQKRGSLWKSHSLSIKPHHASDDSQPAKILEKRRSFWRSDSKATSRAPAVKAPTTVSTSLPAVGTTGLAYEDTHLLGDATTVKAKRSSLRLSLRRTVSSKSSRSRLSWLGGRMDDSDDEDIPALPPIPANLKREKSRSQDPGRYLGMSDGHYVPPGTAITSDDLYSTAQPVAKSPKKRQSFSSMISKRKSGTDLQKQEQDTSGNKRKRRSWFSVHNPNDNSLDTALPPIPALPNATGSEDSTIDPSEMAFHRFLHNTHNARAQGATTDYERFLRASRAYDESMPSPPYISHSNSLSAPHASLPTATVPTMAPHPATLKRATYAAPSARRSHASRCRPQRQQDEDRPESRNHVFLSIEQQHEWNKLRDLLDDTIKTVSPESSLEGVEDDDEDGVIGMVRELNRNEEREARRRDERRRRDRERGYGAWANDEALARLEFGK